jgi:uncharacterized OsmC-like protein
MTKPQADTTDREAAGGTGWVTARVGRHGLRTGIETRTHALTADEPTGLGGTDAGPTPYEYLLIALSGCTAMTLRMYADRRGWPLESAEVSLRTSRSHEMDCENCATQEVGVTQIERRVELTGPLDEEQHRRLMQVADRCPVKQTLERGITVVSSRAPLTA